MCNDEMMFFDTLLKLCTHHHTQLMKPIIFKELSRVCVTCYHCYYYDYSKSCQNDIAKTWTLAFAGQGLWEPEFDRIKCISCMHFERWHRRLTTDSSPKSTALVQMHLICSLCDLRVAIIPIPELTYTADWLLHEYWLRLLIFTGQHKPLINIFNWQLNIYLNGCFNQFRVIVSIFSIDHHWFGFPHIKLFVAYFCFLVLFYRYS